MEPFKFDHEVEQKPKPENQGKKMEYKHFSHPHNLTIIKVQETHQPLTMPCNACKCLINQIDSNVYTCSQWDCSFFLHEHCGNASRYVNHPSHAPHPLVLIPSPTYCSGSYICNACGKTGTSFAYCCAMCEIDLHVHCAFLPFKISHESHQHELFLNFGVEPVEDYLKGSSKFCKICNEDLGLSNKCWFYGCEQPDCNFRLHTGCGTTEVNLGLYQGENPDDDDDAGDKQTTEKNSENDEVHRAETDDPEDGVLELQRLKMEMEQLNQLNQFRLQMAQQSAQNMISWGNAFSNLA